MATVEVRADDLEAIAKLLKEQEDHFGELAKYAASRCGDTTGMTEAMAVLVDMTQDLAGWCAWKLGRCKTRMESTLHDLATVQKSYAETEQINVDQLQHLFGGRVPGINQELLTKDSAPLLHASYRDDWDAPPAPSGETPGLNQLVEQRKTSLVANCEDIWQLVLGGEPLAMMLVDPLTGDYSKLNWLYEAYFNLGNATYRIAENCRRGHATIGPRWDGPAAVFFEAHLFAWGQGIGGLGDLFQICSLIFRWIYTKAMELAQEILDRVVQLIVTHFPNLGGLLDGNPRVRAHLVECGPPITPDVGIPDGLASPADTAAFNKGIAETARFVHETAQVVEKYRGWFETAKEEIRRVWEDLDAASKDPGGYVLDFVHRKGQEQWLNFERRPDGEFNPNQWDPRLGVWRVKLIPA